MGWEGASVCPQHPINPQQVEGPCSTKNSPVSQGRPAGKLHFLPINLHLPALSRRQLRTLKLGRFAK